MKEVKVGDTVRYDNGRGSAGQGVIQSIKGTIRGSFYVISTGGDKTISVRRSHIKA